MLFVTGLLTLLALASAGGDHVKGGNHIKGNPLASATKTVQVIQEEVAPSPYAFNIKTGAAYGTKITREETGDAEGRVKGFYTIDGPRGTSRVVQYQADESGFHANVKTSEPNIKTHSPSNVKIEAVSKKGASPIALSTVQHELPEKIHRTAELHHAAAVPVAQDAIIITDGDLSGTRTKGIKTVVPSGSLLGKTRIAPSASQFREPTARPVVEQQKLIKVDSLAVKGSSPAQVKGASGTKTIVIAQQDEIPLTYSSAAKGAADILPENLVGEGIIALNRGLIQKQGEAGFSNTFGGVIRSDGNLESVSLTSSDLENLSKQIGYASVGPVGQPQVAPEIKKPDQVKPAVVRTSSQRVTGSTRTRVVPGPVRVSEGGISTIQGENIRFILGNDAGSAGNVRPSGQTATPLKPKIPAPVQPQAPFGDGIIAINRELIQKQGEAGFSQTFGGVIRADGNIDGVSITASELDNLSKQIGFGTRGQPIATPVFRKPDQVTPSVVRTSSQRIAGSTRTRVVPGPVRVSGGGISTTQGENVRFILGNDAGSAGIVRPGSQVAPAPRPKIPAPVQPQAEFGDGIIAINRELIQKQGEAGFSQTFGGVIRTDGNIDGVSITASELDNLSKQIGFGTRGQPLATPVIRKPEPVKPAVVRTSSQRVTGPSRTGVVPGPVRVSGGSFSTTQGENVRFILGNDAGSAGIVRSGGQVAPAPKPKIPAPVQPQAEFGDGIIAINRGLIQKQGEAGFTQTFGGVIRTDGNIDGVSITTSELENLSKQIGFGTRGQPLATQIIRKPEPVKPAVVRTSSQRIAGSTRTRVIPGPVRVSGAPISTIQGENLQFILGNDAGVSGLMPTIDAPAPKPVIPAPVQPQVQIEDGIIAINRNLIQKQSEAGFSQTFGGVIQTDGNLDGISITSSEFEDLSKKLGQPQPAPELKKPTPAKPTVIRTSTQRVTGSTQTRVIPGPTRVSGAAISTVQGENTRFVLGKDAGSAGAVRPSPQAVSKPRPKVPALSQSQYADGIIAINRDLIQKQDEAGFSQTFGGVISADGRLDGVSITSSELDDLSKKIRFGTRGQPLSVPVLKKPDQVKPAVVRTSYQRIPGSTGTRIIPGPTRVSGAGAGAAIISGENVRFVLGNDAGSAGLVRTSGQAISAPKPIIPVQAQPQLEDGIIAINRNLIQKQSEAGFSQTFGGVIQTDGNLAGVSITASELDDLTKSLGQPQPVPELKKPAAVKPTVVRTSSQRVTGSTGSAGVVRPGPQAVSAPIPAPVQPQSQFGDGIIAINRELIQKQGEAGFSQTFGGVIRTDGNIDGVSITPSELENLSKQIGFGTRRQPIATPVIRKPESVKPAVVRTSSQRIAGSTRTGVVPGPVRVSGEGISTTQGENVRFILGTDAGNTGVVRSSALPVPKPELRNPNSIVNRNLARQPVVVAEKPIDIASVPISPQVLSAKDLNEQIIQLNRDLINKQSAEGVLQTFSGIAKSDSDLEGGIAISFEDLKELSRNVGTDLRYSVGSDGSQTDRGQGNRGGAAVRPTSLNRIPGSQALNPRQRSGSLTPSGNRPSVVGSRSSAGPMGLQEKINQDRIESQVLQEKFESSFPSSSVKDFQTEQQIQSAVPVIVDAPANPPVQKFINEDGQLQLKLDDVVEQSSLPRPAQKGLNTPVQSKILLGDFSQKYQQEKLPIEIPGYIPAPSFMSPFNYRVPGLSSVKVPIDQEQQQIEQVFV